MHKPEATSPHHSTRAKPNEAGKFHAEHGLGLPACLPNHKAHRYLRCYPRTKALPA
jgi:hypothetical protein